MRPVAPAKAAIFREFEPVGRRLLVFLRVVVAPLTLLASEDDHDAMFFLSHSSFSVAGRGGRHKKYGRSARSAREYSTPGGRTSTAAAGPVRPRSNALGCPSRTTSRTPAPPASRRISSPSTRAAAAGNASWRTVPSVAGRSISRLRSTAKATRSSNEPNSRSEERAPETIRTSNLRLRSPPLYPIELRARTAPTTPGDRLLFSHSGAKSYR